MAERYDYEALGADVFQHLCQSILAAYYPNVQCFPVGMPDGGRDAVIPKGQTADAIVYQIKFRKPTPNKLTTPDRIFEWMTSALEGEVSKVQVLASRGAEKYVVMTNAQCSSHLDSGTRDRVQSWLDEKMPVPSQVWWRDDLDRRLANQTEIKRTYGLIRSFEGLAELLGLRTNEVDENSFIKVARNDPRVSALTKCLTHQYRRDRLVKFKQAELEPQLLDVFIDVPLAASLIERHLSQRRFYGSFMASSKDSAIMDKWAGLLTVDVSSAFMTSNRASGRPAASALLSENLIETVDPARDGDDRVAERIVLEGAPGQGKSTVGQYVCQVHRARLLDTPELSRFNPSHRSSPVRLPFHVDFRDLAMWLRRQDPFDVKNNGVPEGWVETLEGFLSAQVRRYSGGMGFSVSDLDSVLRATPAMLILDGLDEVPDMNDRRAVVACVNEALDRIEPSSPSFRTMVTSRPSSYSKAPGFSKREFTYFTLGDLPLELVLDYTDGWLESRKVGHQVAHEIRQVLGQKLGQPHIVDLARNPMQLAILLWLVRKKGPSLPDKRTALYREYMETFLDREAEKSEIVRDERELILDLHGYVAWELHCLAEIGGSTGSISEPKLKALLKRYLQLRGYKRKKLDLVDQLFTGMTDRVMVLTSRVQNTFEFEVQPLREYFAARYLYSTARTSSPGAERPGSRSDRFEALLRNPYWWNVTRFYAGFSDVGELANLVDLLEELVGSKDDFGLISYSREVALTLLRDQVFTQRPRAVSKVVDLVSSVQAVALLSTRGLSLGSDLSLPADAGGEELVDLMMKRIESGILAGYPDLDAARLLEANSTAQVITNWWFGKWQRARGEHARRLWLQIGRMTNVYDQLSEDQGREMVDLIGSDRGFWHMAVQCDGGVQSLSGDKEVAQFIEAFRLGVLVDTPAGGISSNLQSLCCSLASIDNMRMMVESNGKRSIHRYPGRITEIDLHDNSVRSPRLVELSRGLVNAVASVFETENARNSIGVWVGFHESLKEILGGECTRTLALAVELGRVRCGNLSGRAITSLADNTVSPVTRARFARQQRSNAQWWAAQAAEVRNINDAFFVLCCMSRWAAAPVLVQNAKILDRWVKALDPYSLNIVRSLSPRLWTRLPGDMSIDWPSRVSPGMTFLGTIHVDRKESLGLLAEASKACKDRELVGLIGGLRLSMSFQYRSKEPASTLEEVSDAYSDFQRGAVNHLVRLGLVRSNVAAAMSREILRRAAEVPVTVRFSANEMLSGEVSQKASALSAVADKADWFGQEAID